ncbi:hypothetical protein M8C21_018685 [Ambrosia artemisiifolia]|uniref:Uncharacterized protein n=1 Tax=Ambrosia artemisiifolia TaxID=4212 RepID=A0AAD5DDX8_AMBAR|nr:hypothetical protein M8C21_018685 [Ambrosia artemisiifolia]
MLISVKREVEGGEAASRPLSYCIYLRLKDKARERERWRWAAHLSGNDGFKGGSRGRKLKGGREGWREQRNQQREEDPTGDKKKRSEKQKRIEKERIYGGYCGTQRRARSDLNGEILKLTSISSNNVLRLVIVSIGTLKGDEYVMVTVNVR